MTQLSVSGTSGNVLKIHIPSYAAGSEMTIHTPRDVDLAECTIIFRMKPTWREKVAAWLQRLGI